MKTRRTCDTRVCGMQRERRRQKGVWVNITTHYFLPFLMHMLIVVVCLCCVSLLLLCMCVCVQMEGERVERRLTENEPGQIMGQKGIHHKDHDLLSLLLFNIVATFMFFTVLLSLEMTDWREKSANGSL